MKTVAKVFTAICITSIILTVILSLMSKDVSLSGKTADVSCISGGVPISFKDARIVEANPDKHFIQLETKEGHEFFWWGDTLIEIKTPTK